MRKRALRIVAVFVPLISPSMVAPPGDLESFDDTVRSDVAGSVTVESSFTEAVSVPGVEGAGVENVDAAGAGGVVEVVEGPVGGFRVPGWQVRCKIGTGTAGATPADKCTPPPTEKPEGKEPDQPATPSTDTIARTALNTITLRGAGLTIQPHQHAFTEVPSNIYAATPTQTHTLTVFNHTVTLTLHASTYTFDFNDHTPPLVTTTPGNPYPNMVHTHSWQNESPHQTVTLTTTWDVTLTNPFTGTTHTIPSITSTRETSAPFLLTKPHQVLTDHAEKTHGH
ncbi:hypothetical protein SAMN04489714_1526 [Schaalia radingae]|uniref:Uncharacterized protein n=1 Tax=Schaalia radingae TaxID=131110 RepID=A0ABY0V9I3_9ACTO|nr:hypothetical protein SAMN04489714_1526 [Schaalia radingae]